MDLFRALFTSLAQHGDREAFFINGQGFTYSELAASISAKRSWIRAHLPKEEVLVGLVGFDDLHTYASILALWSEGKAYLPIAPKVPIDRNQGIIAKAGISTLFVSMSHDAYQVRDTVRTDELPPAALDLSYSPFAEEGLAYVLFTSGTTGQPKGVPITRANLAAFVAAFGALGITLVSADRCLQMFELTFDVSVMSFVLPLLCGACVHTVPQSAIKYMYIAELLGDRKLTMAPMVPSVITYLRPYFDEIRHPDLKYCVFAGEALPLELTAAWSECVPNARIYNAYGPTEHTVVCTQYLFQRGGANKERNGIIAIGKQMGASVIVVIDEDRRILPSGSKGELCLSGPQLTAGYWNDADRTAQVMFVAVHEGVATRFYRTGDLCLLDEEGDIMYLGRLDQQAKIQGFRVELGEVEHFARVFLKGANLAALAVQNEQGITEIMLAIEGEAKDPRELLSFMRKKLPVYMIPTRVNFVPVFPLGTSGKTDRKALQRGLIRCHVNHPDTIRKATGEDIPFLVEAIVSAEKSGTPRFGLASTFGLSEREMRVVLTDMFKEEVDHCEISVSSFLIAECEGAPAAAVAGWVEGADGEMPSALLKANLLGYTLPESSMQELARRASAIEGVRIDRMRGALQIEYVHVDERFRGRRLGIRLIEAHLLAIRGSDPPVTRAQVQAFADNRAAIALYEKLGFAVVRTCTSEDPDTPDLLPYHSKVLMERPLP